MAALYDSVKMTVSGTPGTGTITLGAAASGSYFTFAEAGVPTGAQVTYRIDDSGNVEIGRGTYTSSGTTLSRTTIINAKVGGTQQGTAISATSAATVSIVEVAEDMVLAPNNLSDLPSAVTARINLGISNHPPCRLATAAALPAGTYANGSSGVGATFSVTATGTLTVDGSTVNLNDRILVKNQASSFQNGIYLCTTAGATGVAAVLTRDTDFNTAEVGGVQEGATVSVQEGTANAATLFIEDGLGPFTIGTTAITFDKALMSSNNLSDVAATTTAVSNLGGPFLIKANNLSDVTAATARTNLGLAIGTNVQAFDAQLSSNIPINSQSSNYTLVLTDGEKCIYHTSATAHTFTIPTNASVAYPVGTTIHFANEVGGGVVTISCSDTMVLAGSGNTSSRSLAASGMASALKVATTTWLINGIGLT